MEDDLTAVYGAVLDYAEGWYLGDAQRMAKALHSGFIKRRDTGEGFETFGRAEVIDFIERGIGDDFDCEIEIIVDDVSETIASARCFSCHYVDLVHLGKFDDGWKLVHAYYRHL